jgi:hypothetical protein
MNIPSQDGFSSTLEDIRKISKRQVEHVKIKMGIQIDDAHFRNMLMESQVWRPILEILNCDFYLYLYARVVTSVGYRS